MKQIRIGNDIKVTLTVTRHHHPEPLAHKDIVVMLRNKRTAVEITDFHVEDGNKVTFVWRGEEQTVTGPYYATLYIRKGQHQNVEDTGYIFTLVPTSHDIKDCDRHHHHGGVCEDGGKIDVGVSVGAWCDWHEHADYRKLHHRPAINGVELLGNLSLHALGIQPEGDYVEREELKTVTDGIKARFEGIDAGIGGMRKELNDLNYAIEQALNGIDGTGILPFDVVANLDEVKEYPDGTICFVPGAGGGFVKADSTNELGHFWVYVVFEGVVERHLVTRTDVVYRCGEALYRLERYLEDGVLAPSYSYRLHRYIDEDDILSKIDREDIQETIEQFEVLVQDAKNTAEEAKEAAEEAKEAAQNVLQNDIGVLHFDGIVYDLEEIKRFPDGTICFYDGLGGGFFKADSSSDIGYTHVYTTRIGNVEKYTVTRTDVVYRMGGQLYKVEMYLENGVLAPSYSYKLIPYITEDVLTDDLIEELDPEDMADVLGNWKMNQ